MALWRFHLLARDLTELDSNGWPLSRFTPLTADVEEKSALKAKKNARMLVYNRIKKPTAIIKVERVGKRTNKEFDWFSDDPEELPYLLDENQQRALETWKQRIWSKAMSNGEMLPQRNSLLIDSITDIKYLTTNVACFYDMYSGGYPAETRILPHERAYEHIAALQNFYSNISEVELQILCLSGQTLTPNAMDIIRTSNNPDNEYQSKEITDSKERHGKEIFEQN